MKSKAERHREANMRAMAKNLAKGKTSTGQDPDGTLLQFSGDGSLIVPDSVRVSNPSSVGHNLALVAF